VDSIITRCYPVDNLSIASAFPQAKTYSIGLNGHKRSSHPISVEKGLVYINCRVLDGTSQLLGLAERRLSLAECDVHISKPY
jgi:hypothetical protein